MRKIYRKLVSAMAILCTLICIGVAVGADNTAEAFTGSSPFNSTGYSSYYHNDKFTSKTILHGVDVSEYQPASKVNWNTAKSNGVQFVILRTSFTGYGSAGNKVADTSFAGHYQKAKAAGLPVGVYVFSQATSTTEAINEANYAISILQANGIGPDDLDLPIYMDYEYAGGNAGRLTKYRNNNKSTYLGTFTACADAFCKTVANAGYTPGVYASLSFMQGSGRAINGSTLGGNAKMWCAQYYNQCTYSSNYDMWQYSSSAKISGIYASNGNKSSVDVDYWYVDDPTIIGVKLENIGLSGLAKAEVAVLEEAEEEENASAEEDTTESIEETGDQSEQSVNVDSSESAQLDADATQTAATSDEGTANSENNNVEDAAQETEAATEDGAQAELAAENNEEGPKEYLVTLSAQAAQIGYTMDEFNIYGIVPGSTVGGIKSAVKLDESLTGYTMQVVNAKTRWVYSDDTQVSTGKMLNILDASGQRVASLNLVVNGSASVYATSSFQYDGGVKTTGIVAIFNGVTVANGGDANSNYVTIYHPAGRTLPGTYTVTVCGNGILSGTTYYASYGIYLKNTAIKSLSRKSRGFKAKWYKLSKSDAKGYQLQYSRNSNMTSSKTKKITSYKTKTKTITKLKKKKYYYVRIRTYRKISGTTYYSPWSEIRTVKTK